MSAALSIINAADYAPDEQAFGVLPAVSPPNTALQTTLAPPNTIAPQASHAGRQVERNNTSTSAMVLTQPALGQDIQLGMLYDARSAQFFGGVSLWDDKIVNANQVQDVNAIQNGEFHYSYSLDEARTYSGLNIEGSLGLDLGIVQAVGSAKFLNDKKSSVHEVRIDVSCTVVRRTRRIPQEILATMQHEGKLDDPLYTHFVAEVVEGGTATLSFQQSCSSAEHAKELLGQLKIAVMGIEVGANATGSYSKERSSILDNTRISYSGAMAENVSTIEDARRVANEMPTKLKQQFNTLHFKLLPLSVLDNGARRAIRGLDASLVNKASAALRSGRKQILQLQELVDHDLLQKSFGKLKKQIFNFRDTFTQVETDYQQAARRLLPKMRDGNSDFKTTISELLSAVELFERQISFAERFVDKKRNELGVLKATVATLLADGFEDNLEGMKNLSLAEQPLPKLLLSFGASMNETQHPLQKRVVAAKTNAHAQEDDHDSDSDDDDDEWFENPQIVANFREACANLRSQRLRSLNLVTFGIATVKKAYRPGKTSSSKTVVGDIILDYKGKLHIVTNLLPEPPNILKADAHDQNISVEWDPRRPQDEELIIPTTGYVVQYRPQPNLVLDGPFPRVTENEAPMSVVCKNGQSKVVLGSPAFAGVLYSDCDYEIEVCRQTILGQSEWSSPVISRTERLPSVASELIGFFKQNRASLTSGEHPWALDDAGVKMSLYLGLRVVESIDCTDKRYEGQLAVRLVDVAPEFKQEVRAASVLDENNTIVVLFAGSSGHGKSTEINAFISFLFGGAVDDEARIMVVDDRRATQTSSVTQHVTCYRIRPLSPAFEGKTLLVVDTPGYGDSRGLERDNFVTAAMSEFFKTIQHVNAVIFACRASENRTTFLSPVSTYVFGLFAKDVRSCLQTIYTFSDAGTPSARAALRQLNWPVQNGEVEVNNAAFTAKLDTNNMDKVRDWWNMSVKGQHQLLLMLLKKPAVLTASSAAVVKDRLDLERKCELVEKKIFETANDAQILIANLGAIANAVGAAPNEKVRIEEDRAVSKNLPEGQATTLCMKCNRTCHFECAFADDSEKEHCAAMADGKCTICVGRCAWDVHKNARYYIEVEKYSEWIVPHDLIKRWDSNNKTLEGALLGAIDEYLTLQEGLRNDIMYLAALTEKLKQTALLHNPSALINYIDTLIHTARSLGAPPAQLQQLTTAKKTLTLARSIDKLGQEAAGDSQILVQILHDVQQEMYRRTMLEPRQRASEEEKACTLYNNLYEKLPPKLQKKAPARLKTDSSIIPSLIREHVLGSSVGARYPENLQAVIKLIGVVLTDGGVVSALTTST